MRIGVFNYLRKRRYQSAVSITLAYIVLVLFGQANDIYPVENINIAYGYVYYFFMQRY